MAKLLTGTRIYGTGTVDTQLFVSGTNSATSTTTGALQVVGGVGVGGNLYVGGTIYGAVLGTATTATNSDNVKTVSQTTNASYYPAFVDSNNSTAAYEALYTTSSFVINPQSGNVGIGESDPLRKFVVRSDSSGGITAIGIYNGSTATGNGSVISFRSDTTGAGATTFQEFAGFSTTYTDKNHSTRSGDFNIFTVNSGTVATRVIVKSTGDVGIGFTSPNGKLDVAGDLYVGTTQNTARFKSDSTNTFVDAIPAVGAVVIRAGGSVEKLRVTANGGVSFGASGTAYGTTGQILQSNGDAAPTWISTGSLTAAIATTATHLAGGVAGQIPYQTAPGVTSFLSTGTAGNVLVSNGSSAATYNNTLTLTGTTAATSTTTGALQVVGGFGLGGDLFIRGDIATNDTTFNLINSTATTVNFAGAATTLTMGASGSGTTNVRNNLTVSGNLTVQGTTTIVDSTVTNIADPILTLGGGTGNTAPTADDNKDRGVAFKWVNDGGTTSTGFFGYDDSTGYFTYVQTATITNEVVSGTKGAMDVNLAGGTAMSIVYQSSPNTTAFLAASTGGYILQTNGTGSAPSWVSASGVSAGSATYADNVRTIAQTASASYYPTFVDSNNASNAYELVYTTSSFYINPATGKVVVTAPSVDGGLTLLSGASGSQTSFGVGRTAREASFAIAGAGSDYMTGTVAGDAILMNRGGNLFLGMDGAYAVRILTSNTERVRIDSSGNVNIGTFTSSIAKKFTVVGEGNFSDASNTARLYMGFGTIPTTGGTGAYIYNNDNSPLAFGTTNTERMRIDALGTVGIGETTPATYATTGSLVITNTTFRPEIALRTTTAIGGTTAIKLGVTSSIPQGGAVISSYISAVSGQPTDLIFSLVTSGTLTERLRITSNGGIAFSGSTSYGSSGFVLKSNGDAAPTWVDPGTLASASATYADQIRTLATGTNASYYPAFVDSNNASNAYELVYTTSSFAINPQSGNVGIGTTSPSVKLHVVGNTYLNGVTTSTGALTVNSTLNAVGKMSVYVPSTNTITFADNTSTAGLVIVGTGDRVRLQLGVGSNLIGPYGAWIQASYDNTGGLIGSEPLLLNPIGGNVGIGTTSTSYKLDVAGSGRFTPEAVNDQGFFVTSAAGAVNHYFDVQLAPGGGAYSYLRFQVAGNNIFTWGSSLSAYTNNLALNSPSGAITLNANGSERLRITSNGGIAFGGSTNYGSAGQMLQSNGDTAPTWVALSSRTVGTSTQVNTVLQTASATYYPTFVDSNNATAAAESLYTTSSFSINPGTGVVTIAAPAGGDGVPSLRITQGTAPSTFNWLSSFLNSSLTAGKNLISLIGQAESGNNSAYFGFKYVGASSASNFATIGLYGADNLLNILANGNVGIGTTSPPNKLTVSNGGAVGLEISPTGGYTTLGGVDLLAYNRSTSAYAPIGFITNSSNNSMVILTSGNVGIATVAPSAKLHVSGNAIISGNAVIGATTTTNKFEVAGTAGQLFSVSDSFTGTIFSVNDVSGIPSIEVLDTGLVKIAQYNGAVTIGTGTVSSSTAELSVYGMLYTSGAQGEIRASSEITAYFSSDSRLKENIKLIENPITIIDQIRGVTFDWTDEHMARRGGEDGYFVRKHDIGVIAQEVQAVLPELVGTREDGYLAVKYEKMVPLLIEAIKEQQKTIDSLVKDLANVTEFINNLKNKNGI